jgi:hypothetical protein
MSLRTANREAYIREIKNLASGKLQAATDRVNSILTMTAVF